MHFVGVDLAWGDRNPTRLAVVDPEGHLLHVSAARTDDEIVEVLAEFLQRATDQYRRLVIAA